MGTSTDLSAIVLQLRVCADGTIPAYFGHQAQALILELIRQTDPALAHVLHQDSTVKPYTVAPLMPLRSIHEGRIALHTGATLLLRIALLHHELLTPCLHTLQQPHENIPIRLGSLQLSLINIHSTPAEDPWANTSSFTTLAEESYPARRLIFHFITPTAFSLANDSHGQKRVGVLPDPHSVFGSLLRRWNALAPTPLDETSAARALAQTLIAEYDLRTTAFPMGKAIQIGFLGRCVYELRGDDTDRRLLTLLGLAAFYLGVGMKTTRGMGLCRVTVV